MFKSLVQTQFNRYSSRFRSVLPGLGFSPKVELFFGVDWVSSHFLAEYDKIWVSEALEFVAAFYYKFTDDTKFYGTETAVEMIFKLLCETIWNRILAQQAVRKGGACYTWKSSNNMVEDLKKRRCRRRYEATLERHSRQRTLNVDEQEVADCTKID